MKLLKLPELKNAQGCTNCFFYHPEREGSTCTNINAFALYSPCIKERFVYVHPARLNKYLTHRLIHGIRNLSLNSPKETS